MKKSFVLTALLLGFYCFSIRAAKDIPLQSLIDSVVSINSDGIIDVKQKAEYIHDLYKIYENEVIEKEYVSFKENINETNSTYEQMTKIVNLQQEQVSVKEQAHITELVNQYLKYYRRAKACLNRMEYLHKFYSQLLVKENEWKSKYFKLNEQVFYLKSQIDKIYIKRETRNYYYGGMTSEEIVTYRKKPVYQAFNTVYDAKVNELRGLSTDDYYGRNALVEKLLVFMKKVLEIGNVENTRDLEKTLKKLENVEAIMKEFEKFTAN